MVYFRSSGVMSSRTNVTSCRAPKVPSAFRRNRCTVHGSQQLDPEIKSDRPSPSKSPNWGRNSPRLHPAGMRADGSTSSSHAGFAYSGLPFVP